MTTMRAKFRVNAVTYYGDPDNTTVVKQYEMSAVYDTRTTENRRFAQYTPYGDMKIRVDNPAATPLRVGEDYYIDFTPCHQADALAMPQDVDTETHVDGGRATTYTKEAGYTGDVTGTEPMPARHAASDIDYDVTAPTAPGTMPLSNAYPDAAASHGYQTASGQDTPVAPAAMPADDVTPYGDSHSER